MVIAYVLTYASLMLVFGKLGDLLGYRRIFRLGLLVSAAGSPGAGWRQPTGLLLLGRMLQGVGIALVLSCGPALATSLYRRRRARARARRLCGHHGGRQRARAADRRHTGGVLGVAGRVLVPRAAGARGPGAVRAHSGTAQQGSARGFDALGALLLVIWISALLLAFAIATGRSARLPAGAGALALIGLRRFLVREARHPEPIIRPSLFRDAGLRHSQRRQHRRELRCLQRAAARALLPRAHRRPGGGPGGLVLA